MMHFDNGKLHHVILFLRDRQTEEQSPGISVYSAKELAHVLAAEGISSCQD